MKLCTMLLFALLVHQAASITHQFNFASYAPPHLSVMFSMSWFGITPSDPQGAGQDPAYGNWKWGVNTTTCVIPTSDPTKCTTGNQFSYTFPSPQRFVASKRRPLAGIYSASGRDDESLARIDLMLSNVRRPCDGGANARLDSWSVQVDSIRFSSKYQTQGTANYCATCDMSYRALVQFFQRAQKAGMTNVIMPGIDATWIFNFYASVGLTCSSSDKSSCINALTEDIADMVNMTNQYPNVSTRVNGLPVILIYFDGTLSFDQWETILQSARNAANSDFYVIGTGPGAPATMFNAFDGLAPWTSADYSLNNPPYQQAYSWAQGKHSGLVSGVKSYSDKHSALVSGVKTYRRVVFGSLMPGFDDYTLDWGQCKPRVMERSTVLVQAASDYLASANITHTIAQTWDDWTEGTHFEPDVNNGTQLLIALKQGLSKIAGETGTDTAGDNALTQRWTSYGQARNCNGGTASKPPAIDLTCPSVTPTSASGSSSSSTSPTTSSSSSPSSSSTSPTTSSSSSSPSSSSSHATSASSSPTPSSSSSTATTSPSPTSSSPISTPVPSSSATPSPINSSSPATAMSFFLITLAVVLNFM